MTTPAVRDKKIALAKSRIANAHEAKKKHEAHIRRLDAEVARQEQTVKWLEGMPVDDQPTTGSTPIDIQERSA